MSTDKPIGAALVAICFALSLVIGCAGPGGGGDVETSSDKLDPVPDANAFHMSGPIGDGKYVLPNGRRITPAGAFNWTTKFPNDVQLAPDGQRLIVVTFQTPAIHLLDPATLIPQQTFSVGNPFMGILFNGAGDTFWVSLGGSHAIQEFSYVGGVATPVRQFKLFGFPTGMALSPDETTMYVAANMSGRVAEIDLASGAESRHALTEIYPYDLKILPDGSKLYASNWGSSSVTAIDAASMGVIAHIPTGKNPTRLALSPDGSRLYTADADSDTITVIDTATDQAIATYPLHDDPIGGDIKIGSYPNAIDISQDGSTLYVGSAGFYCVSVVDADTGDVTGRIPTGWYTSGVHVDDASDTLYAVNGKGFGSAAMMPSGWTGTVQSIPLPDSETLDEYTQLVHENISWGHSFFDTLDEEFESPVPTEFGQPSGQIKHVIYVLKENKTYDQYFGDLEGTERDPAHLVFGEEITVNQHRLAEQFTVFDNCYVEGDTSILGHFWATAMQCNEYAEKAFFAGTRYPLSTLEPAAIPEDDWYLWDTLIEADIDFRVYGQLVGMTHDLDTLMPHMDLKYGFWNMGTLDVDKVDEFIREVEAGYFPPLVYILLPNDHHYGSSAGAPTPDFLVGDNDAGLGKLVDYISHSEYWNETAIFITQDDPQSGSDHIDKHRTICLAVSPWVKRGHVSSVMHSGSSIWLTIDLLLGIPPTTKFDQYTAPMYDAFTMTPDYTPYDAVPNPVPFEINEKGLPFADHCARQNFTVPDQAEDMGKVIWALKKPGQPFPYDLSVDEPAEEEEEEAAEARAYMEALSKVERWARENNVELADTAVPFWKDPQVLRRLETHNRLLREKGAGGY